MRALSQGLWVLNSNSATSCLALFVFELNAALSQGLWVLSLNSATSSLALCVFELNAGS